MLARRHDFALARALGIAHEQPSAVGAGDAARVVDRHVHLRVTEDAATAIAHGAGAVDSKPRWCRAFRVPTVAAFSPTRPVHRPQARPWQARYA